MDNDFQSVGGSEAVPDNGRLIRNLGMGANFLMSHILHFYHLLALDYVDVNGTGLIPKGFLCPNYDSNYYARGIDPILQTGGLGAPAYTVNNAPVANPGIPPGVLGDLTPYLAGQYVRALKFRRMAQQLGALFTGKMPQASSYTPGCVTTKPYDPTPGGADAAVVQKVHEFLYGGPAFDPTAGGNHPINGSPLSMANPHPESIMGFVGKPSNFWSWAANGFAPGDLPIWAVAGVPGAGGAWKEYTGTYLFDAVAAAHCFPEYFWLGSGYGRFLAWGIFEGADIMGFGDNRLITRGRVHTPQVLNGVPTPYSFTALGADHLKVREYTKHSFYNDPPSKGRHPWSGKTSANTAKAGAYTFGKAPRYFQSAAEGGPDDYVPYEVGPLARMMSNARGLATPGGPATAGEVLAVDAGAAAAYYPGILADVDAVLGGALGMGAIGVFPGWGTNLTAHLTFLQTAIPGSPVFYLPPNAVSPLALANGFGNDYYGDAVLDRVAARALETYFVGMQMLNWFNAIDKDEPSNKTLYFDWNNNGSADKKVPKKAKGAGLTEAPRGALGHWIRIGKGRQLKVANLAKWKKFRGKVATYQIITPTAWNISPKDHNDAPGPAEYAMMGTPLVAEAEPIEVLRVIHSFDFCCACTVHVLNAKKEKVFEATIDPTF